MILLGVAPLLEIIFRITFKIIFQGVSEAKENFNKTRFSAFIKRQRLKEF